MTGKNTFLFDMGKKIGDFLRIVMFSYHMAVRAITKKASIIEAFHYY